MNTIKGVIATTDFLLLLPGAMFMSALILRNLPGLQNEPAQTAQRVVDWYSARVLIGLDIFLIALPFAAFIIGCITLLLGWRNRSDYRRALRQTLALVQIDPSTMLIAGETLTAGCILVIVAVHVLSN